MMKCTNSRMHEDEGDADDELVARNESNSYRAVKNNEQKGSTLRSKHSETEQRRRSKINERFQALRDIIPQNDQKRDKASFLLEVIEYIQFLNEKLQMYEGSYPGWSEEPTKLVPWRNHHTAVESFMNQSQVIKSGSGLEIAPAEMLTDAQKSVESILGTAATYKDFVSDGENLVSQAQPQLLQSRVIEQEELTIESKCAAPNNTLYELGQIESGPVSISIAYSQGILNSLTQAMRSSGVDLSKASISVQLDVRKRSPGALTAVAASSKDESYINENSEQAHKRLRT